MLATVVGRRCGPVWGRWGGQAEARCEVSGASAWGGARPAPGCGGVAAVVGSASCSEPPDRPIAVEARLDDLGLELHREGPRFPRRLCHRHLAPTLSTGLPGLPDRGGQGGPERRCRPLAPPAGDRLDPVGAPAGCSTQAGHAHPPPRPPPPSALRASACRRDKGRVRHAPTSRHRLLLGHRGAPGTGAGRGAIAEPLQLCGHQSGPARPLQALRSAQADALRCRVPVRAIRCAATKTEEAEGTYAGARARAASTPRAQTRAAAGTRARAPAEATSATDTCRARDRPVGH